MARPEPEVLLQADDFETVWEVLNPGAMWAITLDNEIISLRRSNRDNFRLKYRYPKTVFPTLAVASNWADRLNEIFATDRFGCCRLIAVYNVNNSEDVN